MLKIGLLLLCLLVLAGYALNRGVYIGSSVFMENPYYYLECRYLFPSGVLKQRVGGWLSEADLRSNNFCPMFRQ